MSEWRLTTIGKEAELLTGYPFKSAQYTDSEEDYLLLRGDNIGQGFIRWDNAKRWPTEKSEGLEEYFLQESDVILAMDRPWIEAGLKFAYLSENDLPCLLVQRVSCLRAKERLSQVFLRYVIQGYRFTQYVIKIQTGTAVPHISGTQIKDFDFFAPPLAEQDEIAKTLSTLDRKIENLRKQNETLEQIAQTLFKRWFVDFEFPYDFAQGRPSADGKPYKSSGGEMVPSELCEIPAGWMVEPFETTFLIPLRNGLTKPRNVRGEGVYMVNMGELFEYKRIGDLEMDRVPLSESDFKKSMLEVGDLLFARQSLVREGAGQCSIITDAPEPRTFEGHLIRCRIDQKKANPFYFFYYFWSFIGKFQMRSLIEQVAAAGIRGSELAKLEVLIPPIEIQKEFFEIIEPMEKRITLNLRRIYTLTQTRDALLPKLMSGKLRIQEGKHG